MRRCMLAEITASNVSCPSEALCLSVSSLDDVLLIPRIAPRNSCAGFPVVIV